MEELKNIRVSKKIWRKLKMMKGKGNTYDNVVESIINKNEKSIILNTDVYNQLCEIMSDNNYDSLNNTIREMLLELEKYIGE